MPKKNSATLDERFRFAEASFPGGIGQWDSQLRSAVGAEDRERYLLRLFKKTGTPLDEDLRRLIARGLRRVRRVLSSRRARSVLVEVLEIVEDRDEIGILMLDPGSPVSGPSHRIRARQDRFFTGSGRKIFWRNIARVAEGLAHCHDAGIVHGAVSEHTIFSHSDDDEDYRLGGYEACVHIADGEFGSSEHLLRPAGAVSFRQDWSDLGRVAATILGIKEESGPSLLSIERRMLDRLANPPQFQLFDGNVVLRDLREVIDELERVGSSSEGELVIYPSRDVVRSDLPVLTSGAVQADDTEAVLKFVREDLLSPGIRVTTSREMVRIVTDLAIYGVKVVDQSIGMIVHAHKRRPDDYVYSALELSHRLYLARGRANSEERVRKLGPSAKRWADIKEQGRAADEPQDIPIWYALILLEAFTLLREQFRFYPVNVVPTPSQDGIGLVWVVPEDDGARDSRRKAIGLRPSAEALKRELQYDDGRTAWTLSKLATLGGERERQPTLNYEGSGQIGGKRAYTFSASEPVVPGQSLFLRPRRDSGFERAIRRRLLNIVAARANLELLRALDDPTQVALDEVLREIATPGAAPDDIDPSKKAAWQSIASGKSINIVVGPPGVGKTYLISHLVKSILSLTPGARILISAQNHETLVHMEAELKKAVPPHVIAVRVERSRASEEVSSMRELSVELLRSASGAGASSAGVMANQLYQIRQALGSVDDSERVVADRVFRDTDNLLLRSADVTLASTSSYVIEAMIADGEQFDWVFIEEAARANGAELTGALLLGNRRVMIGDHNQLSPFDAAERQKFYDGERAAELLKDARDQLATISDLPAEIDAALEAVRADLFLLKDVLAAAARLEEPFRSIAEREDDRESATRRPSAIANTLLEQSRMHPAIGELVSNTFYKRKLMPSDRVKQRKLTVISARGLPAAPIVVLDLPSLSIVKRRAFEQKAGRSYRNEAEAAALLAALERLGPPKAADEPRPSLVILSPYQAQVSYLERLFRQHIDIQNDTLLGFASPRNNGKFIYTSDSFQGGEADVVLASLVRNNVLVGSRALGFVRSPQRMNVLLSRAKQKLVLATSLQFIREAVDGVDPDHTGGELGFLRIMLSELDRLSKTEFEGVGMGASIVKADERGRLST